MRLQRVVVLVIVVILIVLPIFNASAATQPEATLVRIWGGSGYDIGKGIAVDHADNIYVSGNSFTFAPSGSLTLLKYDQTGNLLWQRIWKGSESASNFGHVVAADSSGNAYVTGGGPEVLLLKVNSTGGLLWQKAWSEDGSAVGYDVKVDSKNVYIAGLSTNLNASNTDAILLKLNSTGNIQWQEKWGGSGIDAAYGLAVDSSGNLYATGYTNSTGAGGDDVFLLKLDSSGSLLWQRTWGGNGTDIAQAVAVDPIGNAYVAGYTWSFHPHNPDLLLLKFNPEGGLVWAKIWGGGNHNGAFAYGVAVDSSGSIYATGWTQSTLFFNPDSALVCLLKFDSTGNMIWGSIWGGSYGNDAYDVTVDSRGNPVMTGYVSAGPPYGQGSLDNFTLATPSTSVTGVPAFSLANANFRTVLLSGEWQTVEGAQVYAGSSDQFLLKYLLVPLGLPVPVVLFAALTIFILPLTRYRKRNFM